MESKATAEGHSDAPAPSTVDQEQGKSAPNLLGCLSSVNVDESADAEDDEASSTVANKGSDDDENDQEAVKDRKARKRRNATEVGTQAKKGNTEPNEITAPVAVVDKKPTSNKDEVIQGVDPADILSKKVQICLDRMADATASFDRMDDMFDGIGVSVSKGVILCAQPDDSSRFSANVERHLHSQEVFVRAKNADDLDESSVNKLFDKVRTARTPGIVLIRNGELAGKTVADAIVKNAAAIADCRLPVITVVATIDLDVVERSLFEAFSVRPLE